MMRRTLFRFSSLLFSVFAAAALPSCASRRVPVELEKIAPSVLVPTSRADVIDGRGRFREIFRDVLASGPQSIPDGQSSDGRSAPLDDRAALWKLADEPPGTGKPVPVSAIGDKSPPASKFRVVIVPGILAECVKDISAAFADARGAIESLGFKADYIQTGGRRGSAWNADLIRNAVMGMIACEGPDCEKIIFVTHSKGTVDTLEALAKYPEAAARTKALISFSGAVNGSPIADALPDFLLRFAQEMPLQSCAPGTDAEATESLRRDVRLLWLSRHVLPKDVRYYSLAAFATRENTSRLLRPFYDYLAGFDPLNDGQVLCSDAIIPGSVLLGYPNADHWAVAMPVDAGKWPFAASLADKNDYPRAALLKAALLYVYEELAQACPPEGLK